MDSIVRITGHTHSLCILRTSLFICHTSTTDGISLCGIGSRPCKLEEMEILPVTAHSDDRSTLATRHLSRRAGIKAVGIAGGLLAAGASFGPAIHAFAQDSTPDSTPVASPGAIPGIDPQNQEIIDALDAFKAPALETVTPDIARNLPSFADAEQAILAKRGEVSQEAVGAVEHLLIPGSGQDDEILARIYRPLKAGTGLLPVLVYFHGGGFVIANLDTYDASCRALANATGGIVASIAYRRAPEHPFPAAVDDAYNATQYFLSGAGVVGGDPAKVAVVGESAGGNLATVVCLRARDEKGMMPLHQVLVYPVTTFAPEGEAAVSIKKYVDAKPLNSAQLQWFGMYYLADPADATNPYASPLMAMDLSGLPPATIIQAEIDPLQSQGTAYAKALEAAGVKVTRHLYKGVTHEFFGLGAVIDQANEAVDQVAKELAAAFA